MRMKNIFKKLVKFAEILEILNSFLNKILVHIFSRIKVHNALVLPVLSCGSNIWTLMKEKDKNE
jgi:hypothetical protein